MKIKKPVRVTRTYTQRLLADPARVFPLLCPVREAETITYSHTSLGVAGDAFVSSFTEEFYLQFMRDWESRLNHYLTHGSCLRTSDG